MKITEPASPTSGTSLSSAPRRESLSVASVVSDVGSRFGLVFAWVAVIVLFSVLRPEAFLSAANFQNIFGSQAVLLILAIGLLFPLSVGCFDVSIGGTFSLSLMLVGSLTVIHGRPTWIAVGVALGAGLVVGLVNAVLVVGIGVDSFVATLGIGTLLLGVSIKVSNLTLTGIPDVLVEAARTEVFGMKAAFVYGLALTVGAWYVLQYTQLGRYMQFVGANKEVARLAGIRVGRVQTIALLISGVIAAAAGILLAGVLGAADPNTGASYLLPPFAAAFLGATAIRPGRFNAWGTFIAVYFLITGISGLQILGQSGWIEQAFYGGALVVAASLSHITARSRA